MKAPLRIIGKILLRAVGVLVVLILLVYILIRIPAVQDYARERILTVLREKLGTRVEAGQLTLAFPKRIVLRNLYLEDLSGDTLFAGERIMADISMLRLLRNTLWINRLELEGITLYAHRDNDSISNFDFVIDSLSGGSETPQNKTDNPFIISLKRLTLDRIHARFQDAISATDLELYLGHFKAHIREFDMQEQRYQIPEIELKNTSASFVQHQPPVTSESQAIDEAEAAKPLPFDLQVGTMDFEQVRVTYKNAVSAIAAEADLGTLHIKSESVDLAGKQVDLSQFVLHNSDFSVVLDPTTDTETLKDEAQQEVEAQSDVWKFSISDLDFANNTFRYDDNASQPIPRGMDFAHLGIENFSLRMKSLDYAPNRFSGVVRSAGFHEKSGFVLEHIEGNLAFNSTELSAQNLILQTPGTSVQGNILLQYADLKTFSTDPTHTHVNARIHHSHLAISDLLTLVPDLANDPSFTRLAKNPVSVEAELEGSADDLSITQLRISGAGNTRVEASGNVKNLTDMQAVAFDLNIDRLVTGSEDLNAFLPEGTAPDEFRLPQRIEARGTIKGTLSAFVSDLTFRTSQGDITLAGNFGLDTPPSFQGSLALTDLDAGYLLNQDTILGIVTLRLQGELTNLLTDSLTGNISCDIASLELKDYLYRDIQCIAQSEDGAITANLSIADPNLHMQLSGNTQLIDSTLGSLQFQLDLQHANLHALQFLPQQGILKGVAHADFSSFDPDSLNGTLELTGIVFSDSIRDVALDSIHLISTATSDGQSLELSSEFLHLLMTGQYQLTTLFPAIQQSLSQATRITSDTIAASGELQHIALTAEIQYSPLFTQLDSNIGRFSPLSIDGKYHSIENDLELTATSDHMVYAHAGISGLALDVRTSEESLHYNISFDRASRGDIQLYQTELTGDIRDDVAGVELTVRDSTGTGRFHLNTTIAVTDSQYLLSLRPEDLLLNYDTWQVTPDNQIILTGEGIAVRNFSLSGKTQELHAHSEPFGINQPLLLEFSNFHINTITEILRQDSLLAGGIVNGTAVVRDITSTPVFTAELRVSDFSFRGDTLGNIDLRVNNETASTLVANISVDGGGNRLDVNGRYFIQTENIDLTMQIGALRLRTVEAFSAGYLSDTRGILSGELNIQGTLLKPVVGGDLRFDSASVKIPALNATFTLPHEGMRFAKSDLQFNHFTIIDEENNTLNVNGTIYTRTFTQFVFELDIESDQFKVLNTEAGDNDLYYGTLYLDSRIRIRGSLNQPEIQADLSVLDKTRMTVVIPRTAPGIIEREGVVKFVDFDNPQLDSILAITTDSFNTFAIRGIIAFATIKVTRASEFKLIIDQGTGDFLRLRGDAELNASIDPSGKVTMTGTYVLEDGVYELSFNFLKRRFDIRKGSTITWNGEPTSGVVDVTAAYVVQAAPIDLVAHQVADATQSEFNLYKEKLPFELVLRLQGTLLKPEVSFDIVLPEGNYPVSPEVISVVRAKLDQLDRDEAELNKQAFALVLLNRFIADNPFSSMAGNVSAESYARQSVSKLLTQQLNNLTADLISGVDLRFDLESSEDYSTGRLRNRTDLNVAASKRLLDDRLTVTVGSSFELEGANQTAQKSSNIAGDVLVEYQLSKDGRYLLKAYRKNAYEVAVEGQVIETGISFIINMDYDRFREILMSDKEKKPRDR